MKTLARIAAAAFMMGSFTLAPTLQAEAPAAPEKPAASDNSALEEQFIKTMTNAVLVGKFTIEGDKAQPREERYTIANVSKVKGDEWLFNARIQFGGKDVTLPMILPVKWAGDTPMITVTDMGIPFLGKYTARVLIYQDHYAGYWSGGATHQGALFGKIEHPPTTQPVK